MSRAEYTLLAAQGLQLPGQDNFKLKQIPWLRNILKAVHGNGNLFPFPPRVAKEVKLKPESTKPTPSFRTRWARQIIKDHVHNEIRQNSLQFGRIDWKWLMSLVAFKRGNGSPELPGPPVIRSISGKVMSPDEPIKICIIGAGISGLFLAMLLDSLQLPHLSYEILEARERTGGRVFTHHFGPGMKDYYDVGAMRFPKIAPLARTFDLFKLCDIDLAPYYYDGQMCPKFFNTKLHLEGGNDVLEHDPFLMSVSRGGLVPDRTVIEGADNILKRAFSPFFAKLVHDFQEGFLELMRYDHLTTREYLRYAMGLDFYSIWYIETMTSASGLFDQALSEAVLDALDFEYPTASGEGVKWYRVTGGTYRVIEAMEKRISSKPTLGARVKSISYHSNEPREPMSIQIDGEGEPRTYSAVFNTASLPCMRRMNAGPGTLRPGQRAAIQSVRYDASTKIAVKFKSPWWTRYCQIQGGQASTDLPIRTCVYTSPDSDSVEPSRVLLCSYTWAQDAQQMGSLVGGGVQGNELAQLLCHNLALIHEGYIDPRSGAPFGYTRMLNIIQAEFEEYHAYNWYADPCASGAFAYFGPEQFRHFYPELVRPAANGHMFLVGEACSAHHAWISGSLDSAYRGLTQYLHKLIAEGRVPPYVLHALQAKWGTVDEISREDLEWQMYLA